MFQRLILPLAIILATPFVLVAAWNGGDYRLLLTLFVLLQAVTAIHDTILYSRGQERQSIVVDVVPGE